MHIVRVISELEFAAIHHAAVTFSIRVRILHVK